MKVLVVGIFTILCIGFGCTKLTLGNTKIQLQETFNLSPRKLTRAVQYLETYGYLKRAKVYYPYRRSNIKNAVSKFQKFSHLNVSGHLDKMTLDKMDKPRCGVADSSPPGGNIKVKFVGKDSTDAKSSGNRHKRNVFPGNWKTNKIKYRFKSYTNQLSIPDQRREIEKAFKVWTDGTPLSFQEVTNNNEDIEISFSTGFHGDGYPFDGRGLTLAHAFFPGEDKRGGDVHFDGDELWTTRVGIDIGTNLHAVATHEFGHALGLGHSSDPDSVMLPFYEASSQKLVLGRNDRATIRRIYGNPESIVAKSMDEDYHLRDSGIVLENQGLVGGERKLRTGPLCDYTFDAVANIRNELFFIKNTTFWRIDKQGKLIDEKGMSMSSFWTEFPDVQVDAAFTRPSDQYIVFISGKQYWVYVDNSRLESGSPRSICDFGICGVDKIDAAVVWGANKQIYIFRGKEFWKLDDNLKAEIGYPRNISDLKGVPYNLDGAVEDPDGYTYFIKGQSAWRLEDNKLSVSSGYPKYIGVRWFSCDEAGYVTKTTATPLNGNQENGNGDGGNGSFSKFFLIPKSSILIVTLSFIFVASQC
uniref:stromelysin-3-like n=1 Tax=Styela clava TaxID=7725 RepID=UPI00193A63FB|nr:stromelysin-3-like [Styela clava]